MLGLQKMAGGPGNVALGEVAEPTPGPGEVVIEIKAAGVCGSDIHIRHGSMKFTMRYPVVMGHEFSGVVAAVGANVSDLAVGARVTAETLFATCGVCMACRAGTLNLCARKQVMGYVHNGCFARYMAVPARIVHRLPDNVGFREASMVEPLACCVHAIHDLTPILPAEVVVVSGPGSIGLLCVQLAKAAGAFVIVAGTAADAYRLQMARTMGADLAVNIEEQPLVEVVEKMTDGRGADVYLECSGAPAAARAALAVTRRGGRYTQIGLFDREFPFDVAQIVYRELHVQGSVGSRRTSWVTTLKLLASGQVNVTPLVQTAYPLAQWEEAFGVFEKKSAIKVLLLPE
jgi:L-iditol 2-dehydrogenase